MLQNGVDSFEFPAAGIIGFIKYYNPEWTREYWGGNIMNVIRNV